MADTPNIKIDLSQLHGVTEKLINEKLKALGITPDMFNSFSQKGSLGGAALSTAGLNVGQQFNTNPSVAGADQFSNQPKFAIAAPDFKMQKLDEDFQKLNRKKVDLENRIRQMEQQKADPKQIARHNSQLYEMQQQERSLISERSNYVAENMIISPNAGIVGGVYNQPDELSSAHKKYLIRASHTHHNLELRQKEFEQYKGKDTRKAKEAEERLIQAQFEHEESKLGLETYEKTISSLDKKQEEAKYPLGAMRIKSSAEKLQAYRHEARTGEHVTDLAELMETERYSATGGKGQGDISRINKMVDSLKGKEDPLSSAILKQLQEIGKELSTSQVEFSAALKEFTKVDADKTATDKQKEGAAKTLAAAVAKVKTGEERAEDILAGQKGGASFGQKLAGGAAGVAATIAAVNRIGQMGFGVYSDIETGDINSTRNQMAYKAQYRQNEMTNLQRSLNIYTANDVIRSAGDIAYGQVGESNNFLGESGRRNALKRALSEQGREIDLARKGKTAQYAGIAAGAVEVIGGVGAAVATAGTTAGLSGGVALHGAEQVLSGLSKLNNDTYSRLTQGGQTGGFVGGISNRLFGNISNEEIQNRVRLEEAAKQTVGAQQKMNEYQDSATGQRAFSAFGLQQRLNTIEQMQNAVQYAGSSVYNMDATTKGPNLTQAQRDFYLNSQLPSAPTRPLKPELEKMPTGAGVMGGGLLSDAFGEEDPRAEVSRRNTRKQHDFRENQAAFLSNKKDYDKKISEINSLGGKTLEEYGTTRFTELGMGPTEYAASRNMLNTGALGVGSKGASDEQTMRMLTLSKGGFGDMGQLTGILRNLNQVAGGANNDQKMQKLFSEAFSDGFNKSELAQKFVNTAISIAQATGVTNTDMTSRQLGTAAGALGVNGVADERSLSMAASGMQKYAAFTGSQSGPMGALKTMAIYGAGNTLASGSTIYSELNSQQTQGFIEQLRGGGSDITDQKLKMLVSLAGGDTEHVKKTLERMQRAESAPINRIMNTVFKGDVAGKLKDAVSREDKKAISGIQAEYAAAGSITGLGTEAGMAAYAQQVEMMSKEEDISDSDKKKFKKLADEERKSIAKIDEAKKRQARTEEAYRKLSQQETNSAGMTTKQYLESKAEAEARGVKTGGIEVNGKKLSWNEAKNRSNEADVKAAIEAKKSKGEDLLASARAAAMTSRDISQTQPVFITDFGPDAVHSLMKAMGRTDDGKQGPKPLPSGVTSSKRPPSGH